MDYLTALESDYRRLAEVTGADQGAKVPSCPEWTVRDLIDHVAHVYLHKVQCMRLNALPKPWPPEATGETPTQLLQRGHTELMAEFAARDPQASAATWFEPDNTVAFWQRRMAHETVIHRVDAELAASVPIARISDELAFDGIDEALVIFLAWSSRKWADEFTEELSKGDGSVLVAGRWLVSWGSSTGIVVSEASAGGDAAVSGSPESVLLWVWRRADDEAVHVAGDPAKVAQLRELLRIATQ